MSNYDYYNIPQISALQTPLFGYTKSNNVAPKIVNDLTMLPARFIAENLGAKVEWNGEKDLLQLRAKILKQAKM